MIFSYITNLFILHATLILLATPISIRISHADDQDNLLQGINSFRQSANVPPLSKNGNADCLADGIVEQLEDQPCTRTTAASPASRQPQFSNYPDRLQKCKVDVNTTLDGALLPVCVPNRVETLVLTNYTQTQYAALLNNSRYTGIGIGMEDDWVVVVLTTDTPAGTFANVAHFFNIPLFCYFVPLLLAFYVMW